MSRRVFDLRHGRLMMTSMLIRGCLRTLLEVARGPDSLVMRKCRNAQQPWLALEQLQLPDREGRQS